MIRRVGEELDERDQWMGIKRMKKGYTPNVWEKCDAEGKRAPPGMKAENTAKYLFNPV